MDIKKRNERNDVNKCVLRALCSALNIKYHNLGHARMLGVKRWAGNERDINPIDANKQPVST